jgi:hypothetical protein
MRLSSTSLPFLPLLPRTEVPLYKLELNTRRSPPLSFRAPVFPRTRRSLASTHPKTTKEKVNGQLFLSRATSSGRGRAILTFFDRFSISYSRGEEEGKQKPILF